MEGTGGGEETTLLNGDWANTPVGSNRDQVIFTKKRTVRLTRLHWLHCGILEWRASAICAK
jgi:hypothetical protein